MALMPCPDCGGEMSTEAHVCPKCGRPNKALQKRLGKKLVFVWVLLIGAFLGIWQLLNSGH
jgi:uncharacterized OB-fold protein